MNKGCLLTELSSLLLDIQLSYTCHQRANEMEQLVPRKQLERIKGNGHRFASEACFSSGGVWRVSYTAEHLQCFESQDRRRFFSSGPDIGFKGISYDPQWAGTLTSGNFLWFFFGGGASWVFSCFKGLPRCLVVKNMPASAEDACSIPGLGRSPRAAHGNPLHYSCLENPMDRGSQGAMVHRVTKSQTWLKWFRTCTHT